MTSSWAVPSFDLLPPRPTRRREESGRSGRAIDIVPSLAVLAFCEVLAELRVDAAPLLAEARLVGDAFGAPSFAAFGRLLARGAHAAACPHLGLLVGQRTTLAALGPVGALMRHSPTIGAALAALEAHHGRFNRGAVVGVTLEGDWAFVSYAPYQPDVPGAALHCERALAALANVLRAIDDPAWAPEEVLLPRAEPPDASAYGSFFRARVRFDQDLAALVLPAHGLARRIEGADPLELRLAEQRIRRLEAAMPIDVADDLRRHLRTAMVGRQLGLPRTRPNRSPTIAIHPRTLSRRLREEGTSFRRIAKETRLALGMQLLRDTNLSLVQISAALEFSEPAAFTHAFRRWTGTTPSAWRSGQGWADGFAAGSEPGCAQPRPFAHTFLI